MGMSLELTPSYRQELQQICDLCGIHSVTDTDMDIVLFGAKKYSYCPKCGNSTVEFSQDPIWQLQVDMLEENKRR